jgi:hypothetical protein
MSANAIPLVSTIGIVLLVVMTASAEYLLRWTAWSAQVLTADPLRPQAGREPRNQFYC